MIHADKANNNKLNVNLQLPFPWKLYQILEDSEKNGTQNVIAWLPTGKGFVLHKEQEFTNRIMTCYFQFTSFDFFSKELDSYGFKNHKDGSSVTFFHPRYKREDKTICLSLRRKYMRRSLNRAEHQKNKQRDAHLLSQTKEMLLTQRRNSSLSFLRAINPKHSSETISSCSNNIANGENQQCSLSANFLSNAPAREKLVLCHSPLQFWNTGASGVTPTFLETNFLGGRDTTQASFQQENDNWNLNFMNDDWLTCLEKRFDQFSGQNVNNGSHGDIWGTERLEPRTVEEMTFWGGKYLEETSPTGVLRWDDWTNMEEV